MNAVSHSRTGHPQHGTAPHTAHKLSINAFVRSVPTKAANGERGAVLSSETRSRFIQLTETTLNITSIIIQRLSKCVYGPKSLSRRGCSGDQLPEKGKRISASSTNGRINRNLKERVPARLKQVGFRGAEAEVNYSSI